MEEKATHLPQAAGPRRRGGVGKWLQLVFGLGIVLAIALSWLSTTQNQATSHSPTVPPSLGEMELLGQLTGDEARAEIAKLHGKGIEMVDAYVAEYGHGRSRVTAWVGTAASEVAASGLLKQMVDRIAEGNQAFRNLRVITVSGQEVFAVEGAGGEHFFYLADNKVVWLAVRGADSIDVIKKALKAL